MPPDRQYWDELYRTGRTGWDLGRVSPPLKAYIDQVGDKTAAVLIPGGGNGHEAFYLSASGFTNVAILDIAPAVVDRLKEKARAHHRGLTVIEEDFFAHNGHYDLILEQTFFCALDPTMRKSYVLQMHKILNTGGKLAGVLFNKTFDDGPPFGGHADDYKTLFAPYFRFHTWAPCYNSIAPRAGAEWFMILEKK